MVHLRVQAQPIGSDLVDLLATNFEFDLANKLLGGEEGLSGIVLGEHDLEEQGGKQISIPGDCHLGNERRKRVASESTRA